MFQPKHETIEYTMSYFVLYEYRLAEIQGKNNKTKVRLEFNNNTMF